MRLERRRIGFTGLLLVLMLLLSACTNNYQTVFHTSASSEPQVARVPWDYRVVEGTVGDLIGSDMTILPDNHLLPNDDNYGTGDQVWTLQFMDAELTTSADERNDIRLSAWTILKSYKDEAAAQSDLEKLKVAVTTEVDVVGVYKTEYQGVFRNFAVVELPSGNRIKQPIDEARYAAMERQKTVAVHLEEVHDFAEYDEAYAKFRGWAN